MGTVEIITGFWMSISLLYFFILARVYFNVFPVFFNYYFVEKFEWNEKINPEKLKIYLILILLSSFLIWFCYQPFIKPKSLIDIWSTFFIGFIGLTGICFFIENKIRTPSKKYLKTKCMFYTDEIIEQNILLEINEELNNSKLVEEEILDFNNLQILDFDLFKDQASFRKEGNKIVLLKIGGKKKMKDRMYLLSVLNKELDGQFSQICRDDLKRIKKVVFFINKFIVFKCENYPDENNYSEKNFKDWLKLN